VILETGKSPEPCPSTLENCRKLSAINRLLKRSYLDNWVANHRYRTYAVKKGVHTVRWIVREASLSVILVISPLFVSQS